MLAIMSTDVAASATRNRLGCGQVQEGGTHPNVKLLLLGLEAVKAFVHGFQAPARNRLVEVEQDREVGKQPLRRSERQVSHLVSAGNVVGTLVGDR